MRNALSDAHIHTHIPYVFLFILGDIDTEEWMRNALSDAAPENYEQIWTKAMEDAAGALASCYLYNVLLSCFVSLDYDSGSVYPAA
jgi:hypothetical protein